ncbi:MAG: hypothetical protein VB027_10490 [Gordonibacter sp.]|nr:hypothetical protein [Gordonibacter sp.]
MDDKTVDALCLLNNDFYRNQCQSFSGTRRSPWHGWGACLEVLQNAGLFSDKRYLSVFDLACGNLRFEEFLSKEFSQVNFEFFAVDDCDDLVPFRMNVCYQSLDIMAALRKGGSLASYFEAPMCDLAVAFGFMHHIPGEQRREAVLQALIDQTRLGGFVVVSFWQFLNDEKLAAKASVTHARGLQELELPPLDDNDFLLGWQEVPGAYRYCHSFSDDEISSLLASVAHSARTIARFSADGKAGNLNSYAVLQTCRV